MPVVVSNRPLSGPELKAIIVRDVTELLSKDGMFNNNIAYRRVSYDVRVSVHMDNPVYPEHVAQVGTKLPSTQEVAKNPALSALEVGQLDETSEEERMLSEERNRVINSPNMARVEADLPLIQEVRNAETGVIDLVEQKYTKDPNQTPESVGNTHKDKNTTKVQRNEWRGRK